MPATRTIQTTIALAGEAAFRREMESVNRNLRTLKSEVKAAESAFQSQGKSVDTLKNYQSKLQEAYNQTKAKAEALAQAVADAADKYGDNSKEADRQREALAKARAEMSGYEAALHKTSAELEKAEKEEKDAAEGIREVGESSEKAASQLSAMDVALGNMMANLAQKGMDLLKEIGRVGIEYNAQIESYTMAMTTALGSAEAAAAAIDNIKLDAAVTPYSVDALVRANQLLIAAGESADGARATIMALSDAVSATGGGNDELMRMAQNLQQIKNVGKASAMDIKQFQMAGIDVYGILADYTGMAIEDVSQLTITYDLLAAALQAAAQEGGRYFGTNAAQAAALNGQLSTLQDNVKSKLGEAFQSTSNVLTTKVLPAVNEFVAGINIEEVLEQFDDLLNVATAVGGTIAAIKVAKTVGAWATAANEAIAAFGQAAISVTTMEASLDLMNSKLTVSQMIYGVLTGQISGATVSQLALNAAANLFPAAILVAGITAVAIAGKRSADEIHNLKDELATPILQSEDLEEVSNKLQEMKDRYAELKKEINDNGGYRNATKEQLLEFEALSGAIDEVTEYYEKLKVAQEAAAQAEAEHQAHLQTTAGKIETLTGELKEMQAAYDKAYQAAYDSLIGQFDLFEKVEPVVAKSADDMIAALESQAEYFNRYADNLDMLHTLTAEGIGLNANLVEGLTDGSEKSVVAAETLVKGYQDALTQGEDAAQAYVERINSAYEAQQEAADRAAREMVETQANQIEEMEAQLQDLNNRLIAESQAAALNASGAWGSSFTSGLSSALPDILSKMFSAGQDATNAFQAGLDSGELRLPPIKMGGGRALVNNESFHSHALGLDRVPYDGYLAELHRNEMVVPAQLAEVLRSGGGRSGPTINIYSQELNQSTMDYIYSSVVERAGDDI